MSSIWRAAAKQIAPHLAKTPVIYGDLAKVKVSPSARIVNALLNVQSGTIEIRENVFFGHDVLLLTGSHSLDKTGVQRRDQIISSGRDIIVEEGVWINSGAIIIGPCRIGRNAVVLAGSVVLRDVPPNAIVGGIPARILRVMENQ